MYDHLWFLNFYFVVLKIQYLNIVVQILIKSSLIPANCSKKAASAFTKEFLKAANTTE
jgi:hypothetical protein